MGCTHAQTEELVYARWGQVEELILAAPEDDQDCQWDAIGPCNCCGGPSKAELCSRCSDG